ncbi:DNA-binding protein, partial [Vibrio owensii]
MRPAKFSEEEIINAGIKVSIDQDKPLESVTGFAIKKELKGGNYTRFQRIWEEYLFKHDEGEQKEEEMSLPASLVADVTNYTNDLQEQLIGVANALYKTATEQAASSVEKAVIEARETTLACQKLMASAEKELGDANDIITGYESQVSQLTEKLSFLTDQLTASSQTTDKLREDNAKLQGALSALQQEATTLNSQLK